MMVMQRGRRRSLHRSSFVVAGAVGVVVWAAAWVFASGSCPTHDVLRAVSPCRALVGSLAIRVGVVAAATVLLMELVAAGLLRTAETMNEERRAVEGESGSGVANG